MKKIALDVWAANADARKSFDAEGFSAFNLVLRKDLAQDRVAFETDISD